MQREVEIIRVSDCTLCLASFIYIYIYIHMYIYTNECMCINSTFKIIFPIFYIYVSFFCIIIWFLNVNFLALDTFSL